MPAPPEALTMTTVRSPRLLPAAAVAALGLAIAAPAAEKPQEKPAARAAAPPPACVRCGATCDLEPICVCSPGTKKVPEVEYEVECERFCVPGCGSRPWPFGRHERPACASCVAEPDTCPAHVRTKKVLRKESVTKEVDVIDRRVEHLCGACSGRPAATCCGDGRPSRPAAWWAPLTAWWP
jgi:hypothetical protein